MQKILFTGGTGLLGKYFCKIIPRGYFVFCTYLRNTKSTRKSGNLDFLCLDITDKNRAQNVIERIKPEIIVHAASLGNVDYCENHKKEAKAVNIDATTNLVELAKKFRLKFIFTSSNAVFDGSNPPYDEKSLCQPLDYYGFTKLTAEQEIKKQYDNYVIVRLMTMFGWNNFGERQNPAAWIIEHLRKKQSTKVVDDIYNNYLYAGQAAEAIWKIIKLDKKREIYNIAGKECISRFKFAQHISEVFNLDGNLLSAVSSSYFASIAPRPKNTCFNTDKMRQELNIIPLTINEGLLRMKNEK